MKPQSYFFAVSSCLFAMALALNADLTYAQNNKTPLENDPIVGPYGSPGFGMGGIGGSISEAGNKPITPLLADGSNPDRDQIDKLTAEIKDAWRAIAGQIMPLTVMRMGVLDDPFRSAALEKDPGYKQLVATLGASQQLLKTKTDERDKIEGRSEGWMVADAADPVAKKLSFSCASGERLVQQQPSFGASQFGCLNSKGFLTQSAYRQVEYSGSETIRRLTYERDSDGRIKKEISKDDRGATIHERTVDSNSNTIKRFNGGAVTSECTYAGTELAPAGFGRIGGFGFGGFGGGIMMDQPVVPLKTEDSAKGRDEAEKLQKEINQTWAQVGELSSYLDILRHDQNQTRREAESLQKSPQAEWKSKISKSSKLKAADDELELIEAQIRETQRSISELTKTANHLTEKAASMRNKHGGWSWASEAETNTVAKEAGMTCGPKEKLAISVGRGSYGNACIDDGGYLTKQSYRAMGPDKKTDGFFTTTYTRENGRLTKMTTVDGKRRPSYEWESKSGATSIRIFENGKSVSSCTYFGDSVANPANPTGSGATAR